jgi:hypothetical protein
MQRIQRNRDSAIRLAARVGLLALVLGLALPGGAVGAGLGTSPPDPHPPRPGPKTAVSYDSMDRFYTKTTISHLSISSRRLDRFRIAVVSARSRNAVGLYRVEQGLMRSFYHGGYDKSGRFSPNAGEIGYDGGCSPAKYQLADIRARGWKAGKNGFAGLVPCYNALIDWGYLKWKGKRRVLRLRDFAYEKSWEGSAAKNAGYPYIRQGMPLAPGLYALAWGFTKGEHEDVIQYFRVTR